VYVRAVTPEYFQALGTRVLRGRSMQPSDVMDGERVVVVDQEFVHRVLGDVDPLGRELVLDGPPNAPPPRARIVGVVETIHMNRLDADLRPTVYSPFSQAIEGFYMNWGMDVVVAGASRALEPEIKRAVHDAFPDAVVFRVATMREIVSRSTAARRFQLLVLGFFGSLALVLATIGVSGTLLLAVREQRREMAVQLALGARPERLWWGVQRSGLLLTGLGALLGASAAWAGATVFSAAVYGIQVRDPLSLLAGPLVMVAAGFLAAAIPASRALRVSPVAALRET
jgi:hypothetical protein